MRVGSLAGVLSVVWVGWMVFSLLLSSIANGVLWVGLRNWGLLSLPQAEGLHKFCTVDSFHCGTCGKMLALWFMDIDGVKGPAY